MFTSASMRPVSAKVTLDTASLSAVVRTQVQVPRIDCAEANGAVHRARAAAVRTAFISGLPKDKQAHSIRRDGRVNRSAVTEGLQSLSVIAFGIEAQVGLGMQP